MMKDFEQLFDGWVAGTLTKEEAVVFLEELGRSENDFSGKTDQLLQDVFISSKGNDVLRERLFRSISERKALQEKPVRRLWKFPLKWAAAAVLILVAGAAAWWLNAGKEKEKDPVVLVDNNIRPVPGGDKAILTLSNGEKILLDSSVTGQLAEQQGALVIKAGDGQIIYQTQGQKESTAAKIAWNTLSTPRGGQYRLNLPDGTQVWLNAASSITYPTRFTEKERTVSITGEAYFEVAKQSSANGKTPFRVKVAGLTGKEKEMDITVLGTHFNVNAYADEPVARATLLEGSIKLKKGEEQFLLHPGQQAQLENDGAFRISADINAEEVLAWKNGFFYFHRTGLQTVMRQIARWYDVEIVYQAGVPDMKFGGEIPRNANLEQVLRILQESKLRFMVDGKKIIVIP